MGKIGCASGCNEGVCNIARRGDTSDHFFGLTNRAGKTRRVGYVRRSSADARHTVTLRWVPNHSEIEGNDKADATAKETAAESHVKVGKWSSLTERKLLESEKEEMVRWHNQKMKEDSDECWWCGRADQTVEHLYFKCWRWRRERRVLQSELAAVGIKWQRRPEKNMLACFLALSMGVGDREGAAERAEEWEQRNDCDGEDLLGV